MHYFLRIKFDIFILKEVFLLLNFSGESSKIKFCSTAFLERNWHQKVYFHLMFGKKNGKSYLINQQSIIVEIKFNAILFSMCKKYVVTINKAQAILKNLKKNNCSELKDVFSKI